MEIIAGVIATIAIVGLGYATRQGRSLSFYGIADILLGGWMIVLLKWGILVGPPEE